MKLLSQNKKAIIKKILVIAHDIRDRYILMYDDPRVWDRPTQNAYLINSDLEIFSFLRRAKIKAHETALQNGITLWTLGMQKTITINFTYEFGEDMPDDKKVELLDDIIKRTYEYIMEGKSNVY